MCRSLCIYFRQNTVFFIGLCIGISLGLILIPFMDDDCFYSLKSPTGMFAEHVSKRRSLSSDVDKDDFEPQINFVGKPKKALKTPQLLARPRYYSTELGIREKLFVGVLTSKQNVNSHAIATNKTVANAVNKIMFFIDSPGPQKLNVTIPGMLGFSDTRKILKPFHAIKYILDNLLDDFDFFFLVNDKAYIKARKLYSITERLSVSREIHMASGKTDNHSPFCSLDAGILLSQSVMQKIRRGLDWCVKNAFSDSDDDNVGRCIVHSSGLPCTQYAVGETYSSIYLPNEEFSIDKDLSSLSKLEEFHKAVTIYPVSSAKTIYKLHAYFTRVACETNEEEIEKLKEIIVKGQDMWMKISSSPVEKKWWPIGSQSGSQANSRFDLLPWDYFTENSIYPNTDFSSERKLSGAELQDIQYVINTTVQLAERAYNKKIQFRHLLNGYRRFDPSRGMDYMLDLTFRDSLSGLETQKRFEVNKQLGSSEIIPMPYVTENTRVTIMLPVWPQNANWAIDFIKAYGESSLSSSSGGNGAWTRSTFLLLALLYDPLLPGKGHRNDVFGKVKSEALSVAGTIRGLATGNSGIAWVSMKSPVGGVNVPEFALVDLAVKKVSQDSLIFYSRPNAVLRLDLLNRIRMNTILGWQVFSPIPFAEYHPDIVYTGPDLVHRPSELDVNKSYGHFDKDDTNHISFYVKDYLAARKKIEDLVPIVRSEKDLSKGYGKANEQFPSLHAMFVKASNMHVLRGVEPSLRLWHPLSNPPKHQVSNMANNESVKESALASCEPSLPTKMFADCVHHGNLGLGTRAQLGILLLEYREQKEKSLLILSK